MSYFGDLCTGIMNIYRYRGVTNDTNTPQIIASFPTVSTSSFCIRPNIYIPCFKFRWRTMKPDEAPMYRRYFEFCAVCRALHGINVDDRFNPKYNQSSLPLFSDGISRRVVPSLRQYLYGDDNPECFDILDRVTHL